MLRDSITPLRVIGLGRRIIIFGVYAASSDDDVLRNYTLY